MRSPNARTWSRPDGGAAGRPDRLATVVVWSVAAGVTALFAAIIGDLVGHGAASLSWSFLVDAPRDAGRAGGIAPIVV